MKVSILRELCEKESARTTRNQGSDKGKIVLFFFLKKSLKDTNTSQLNGITLNIRENFPDYVCEIACGTGRASQIKQEHLLWDSG